jgi:hypothetical protein
MKITLQELDLQVSQLYQKFWSGKPESLRQSLSDSPTQYSKEYLLDNFDMTHIVIRSRRRQDLQRLALLSWYMPEEVRILVQLDLREIWRESELNIEKEILLSSKELCLAWIISESGWTESTFFGNVLNKVQVGSLVRSLDFWRRTRRKVRRYTGYCRGYRESNRGAPRSFPPELEVWVIDQEELSLKRYNRQFLLDQTLARLRSFLEAS